MTLRQNDLIQLSINLISVNIMPCKIHRCTSGGIIKQYAFTAYELNNYQRVLEH